MKKIQYIAILFFMLQSCSPLLLKTYGLKTIKPLTSEEIIRQGKKYKIPVSEAYELDSTYYTFIKSLDTNRFNQVIKDHFQPLQAIYYDKTGQMCSFHINCYCGGFPNLKWNRNGNFDVFLPKQQAPIDSIFTLEKQLSFIQPLAHQDALIITPFDYVVVVHWNRYMGRQSKRLIEIVQNNARMTNRERVKIIYVNSDNAFLYEYALQSKTTN
jgi:hypothetical protein